MVEPVRLAKQVAALVPCSRREAEAYIQGGWVRVDGVVVEEPQFRVTGQKIELDRHATPAVLAPVTLLLHKPPGTTPSQAQDLLVPAGRSAADVTGIRTVRKHFAGQVALLPLPQPASGLAVYSQDPRVLRKLTEDARLIEQEVIAEVAGTIREGGLAQLGQGLIRRGSPLPPIKVSWQNENRLRFALRNIDPDDVPWMCEQVGLRLQALKRIRIGRVPLAQLAPGQWRYLATSERF